MKSFPRAFQQTDKSSPDRDAFVQSVSTFPAWSQCVGSFFLLLNSFGTTNTFGAFQRFYSQTLLHGKSDSEVAWIGSIQASLLIGLGIIIGPLFDRGYLRSLTLTGTILLVLGMVLTGLCTELWQLLLAQGIVVGVGCGCLFLPSIAILPQHFDRRLSFAMGIASSGSAIGSICFPILFDRLEPRIGFKWSVWAMALIMLTTMVVPLSVLRMRTHPPQVRKIFDTKAWTEPPFCLWAAYLFISLLGVFVPSFYVQIDGGRMMKQNLASYLLPILNAGSFFGRLIPLYIADNLGPFNIEIPSTLAASLLAFSWLSIHTPAALTVFAFIYGFLLGAVTAIAAPIAATMSPDLESMGVRMGMLLFPWSLGLLVGTPVASALLGSFGWPALKIFTGVTLLVATVLCVLARAAKYGWDGKVRC